ncbi:amidohydrolase [uncultured Roseovarius sp.]|uniref:amidohydrolase n=1 Tax=uncultured Roseovarius sp. TaxID=293344 RepID=UPI0026055341|nr:amidohydrolase [uncultured Roseovarius sp.]
MSLTNSDIAELTAFRHLLHRHPEVSGEERETARRIRTALSDLATDNVITNLGGQGIAATFNGVAPGPTILFRCELDALPTHEVRDSPYRSSIDGKGHLCGHDGHMTILTGLARRLARQRPASGRVILLFQPAEETGAGAAAVIADPDFAGITPDYAFSLHNEPGLTLGHVALKSGPVCCASRGLEIIFAGTPAHASQPETGTSPMPALAKVMPALSALSQGGTKDPDFSLVTVTHATMGEPAFGIAPGEATIYATLRTLTDDHMDALVSSALSLVEQAATQHHLTVSHRFHDIFHHCENDLDATRIIATALDTLGIPQTETGLPWRPSEDFGRFGQTAKSAMLFLGAGLDTPPLHNPNYDFPDDLIPIGTRIFEQIARDLLG